jgi:hypothetical protein
MFICITNAHDNKCLLFFTLSQTFLSDSSQQEIEETLGIPILVGGYHSSKALITFCNTPSPETKEGKGWDCGVNVEYGDTMRVSIAIV